MKEGTLLAASLVKVGFLGAIILGGGLGGIAAAPLAAADPGLTPRENQFISDLLVPKDRGAGHPDEMAHPPLTLPALLKMGHQACTDIRNGVSPDVEKDNVDMAQHAGCRTAPMTTTYPSPESYAVFNVAGRSPLMGVDVATRTRVSRIIGKPALQAVEVENLDSGDRASSNATPWC